MANSKIVSEVKDSVIKAITRDEAITTAIDAPECEAPSDYVGTHVFRYNKNPNTITQTITFLTVMVHTTANDKIGLYLKPTIEIWIYSHNDHMDLRDGEIPGITDDRNTYISELIDLKINGSRDFGGIGEWRLMANTEGTYNEKFLCRKMIFENLDTNKSLCGR